MKTKSCRCCNGSGHELDHAAVGAELRQLRSKAGKTIQQVADKMGITKGHLSALEVGNRSWNEGLIAKYKTCLNALK